MSEYWIVLIEEWLQPQYIRAERMPADLYFLANVTFNLHYGACTSSGSV